VRIAVIGTGISGLAAAWLLDRQHEVHVFEREPRLGGHTHTLEVAGDRAVTSGANRPEPSPRAHLPVDTGFIVYNEPTYPHLTRLFDELGVATQPSDMSWSLSCRRCDLEYAGSARGLVAQPGNLASPSYLRFIRDILRFNRMAGDLVGQPAARGGTVGEFLTAAGLGHEVADHYVLPMAAAIWSTGAGQVRDLPLDTLLTFFANHGLLGVRGHHPWRTVTGGSSSYIPQLTAGFRERIHAGDAVAAVTRDDAGAVLTLASGTRHRVDAVVLATHADEALSLLTDPTPRERELLGAWRYSANDTWLHTDTSLLPARRAAWASWNYLLPDCRDPGDRVSLSYHMNRLQDLPAEEPYVVTLNPTSPPAPEHRLARMGYTHPVYDPASVATQPHLDELNGPRHTYYAGAYHRYGFHEDGLWSAVRVAAHLGVRWSVSGEQVAA
jgi:uncharacterized protein